MSKQLILITEEWRPNPKWEGTFIHECYTTGCRWCISDGPTPDALGFHDAAKCTLLDSRRRGNDVAGVEGK